MGSRVVYVVVAKDCVSGNRELPFNLTRSQWVCDEGNGSELVGEVKFHAVQCMPPKMAPQGDP